MFITVWVYVFGMYQIFVGVYLLGDVFCSLFCSDIFFMVLYKK